MRVVSEPRGRVAVRVPRGLLMGERSLTPRQTVTAFLGKQATRSVETKTAGGGQGEERAADAGSRRRAAEHLGRPPSTSLPLSPPCATVVIPEGMWFGAEPALMGSVPLPQGPCAEHHPTGRVAALLYSGSASRNAMGTACCTHRQVVAKPWCCGQRLWGMDGLPHTTHVSSSPHTAPGAQLLYGAQVGEAVPEAQSSPGRAHRELLQAVPGQGAPGQPTHGCRWERAEPAPCSHVSQGYSVWYRGAFVLLWAPGVSASPTAASHSTR